jgi:hypothetical protein
MPEKSNKTSAKIKGDNSRKKDKKGNSNTAKIKMRKNHCPNRNESTPVE